MFWRRITVTVQSAVSKQERLLDAAHIISDREDRGVPAVPNGIALCTLHHAAFDAHLIAIRPDYRIEVRQDILDESDGTSVDLRTAGLS